MTSWSIVLLVACSIPGRTCGLFHVFGKVGADFLLNRPPEVRKGVLLAPIFTVSYGEYFLHQKSHEGMVEGF